MTGPQHYQESEYHLEHAYDLSVGGDEQRWHATAAQVHATLALAAATALNDGEQGHAPSDIRAWRRATGQP